VFGGYSLPAPNTTPLSKKWQKETSQQDEYLLIFSISYPRSISFLALRNTA